jgi:glycosyltransferase involved in cell wall biosynthesis
MRILQVNKFFYLRGGSERYYFDLCRLLEERGHQVVHFSMQHERNEPSAEQAHFVSPIDLNAPMSPARKAGAALRILYSLEARRKIGTLIDQTKPDLVHFHNITRQLSPAVIDEVSRHSLPMVQTMHDLSLVCPAHSCFIRGRACEACAGGSYWHAVPRRCVDDRLGSSLLAATEAYLHAWMGLYKKINIFIAPSAFLKAKVSTLGWIKDRIVQLPYFIPLGPDYSEETGRFVLFAGRVSTEKGLGTVIEAACSRPRLRFIVAGEGAELPVFKRMVQDYGLANMEFVGYAKGEDLERLIRQSSCVVVPSVSYENLPLSILEAFARGKPVVASACGGIPELVEDGNTGFLFEPGDAESLAHALDSTLKDEPARVRMGKKARELVSGKYSPGYHYDRLMAIYGELTS